MIGPSDQTRGEALAADAISLLQELAGHQKNWHPMQFRATAEAALLLHCDLDRIARALETIAKCVTTPEAEAASSFEASVESSVIIENTVSVEDIQR